jgi:pimeloyl-ACP methyl ester carboxylesterase
MLAAIMIEFIVISVLAAALLLVAGTYASSRYAEALFPATGRFIDIGGTRYHYRIAGSGRSVLLVHGSAGSLHDFDDGAFDALSADFQVIAVDRPGHGHSGRPAVDAGSPVVQARITREILRQLGVERAIVVGHSWSAALAVAYALEFPCETEGLVLVQGTFYRERRLVTPIVRALSRPILGPLLANTIVRWAGRNSVRQTLAKAFHPSPVPRAYAERALAMWTRPSQMQAIAADTVRRDSTIDGLAARYHEITSRVILVFGAMDQYLDPQDQSLRFARDVPTAQVRAVEDGGHQIPMTHPLAVVAAVHALFDLLPAPGSMAR